MQNAVKGMCIKDFGENFLLFKSCNLRKEIQKRRRKINNINVRGNGDICEKCNGKINTLLIRQKMKMQDDK